MDLTVAFDSGCLQLALNIGRKLLMLVCLTIDFSRSDDTIDELSVHADLS
jgi:hypothetical protein